MYNDNIRLFSSLEKTQDEFRIIENAYIRPYECKRPIDFHTT